MQGLLFRWWKKWFSDDGKTIISLMRIVYIRRWEKPYSKGKKCFFERITVIFDGGKHCFLKGNTFFQMGKGANSDEKPVFPMEIGEDLRWE